MSVIRMRGVAVLAFALALSLLLATGASAAPLLGSNFDSNDGDQLPAGVAPLVVRDWQDVATASRLTTNLDNQAADDCFIGGVKEDTPSEWSFNTSAGGCDPAKSDLLGMWSQSELTPTASILHAAFVRAAGNGNTFITFELNQTGAKWTNTVGALVPCRSDGDLLLAYDVGGSTIDVTIYRWTGSGGPVGCPDGANGTFTSSPAANNGMINPAAVTNYLSPGTVGASIAVGLFGEAQIDVAAVLGSMGITGCFSYVSTQAHTRTSTSISSALIDNVPPVATKLANCAVTGTVFADLNADGLRNVTETGVGGRTVYVDVDGDGTRDPGEPFATTDAEGYYVIPTALTAGTFPVRVTVPAGNVCTTPAGCASSATFTASGANSVNNVFGLYVPATVSGVAIVDANGDGVRQPGENTPIAGRTVFHDADADGVHDPGEPSAVTAADGSYTVGGLLPGVARIRFAGGGGWACSGPPACSHTVTVAGGDVVTGRDFLAFQPPSVGGTVFADADADATRGGGEGGLGAIAVNLYAADGTTLLASTVTDPAGGYGFSIANVPGMRPGGYVVRVMPPPGTHCSAPCAMPVTLSSGQALSLPDAGVYADATISGTAYIDSNNDGARNGLEPAEPGVVVYADLDGDGSRDPGEPFATTDAAGAYNLGPVRPGSLHVRAELAPSFACSTPAGCDHSVSPLSGAALTDRDFGLVQAATVTGRVAVDADGSGSAAAGEPPLAGWTVFADLDGDGEPDPGEPSAPTAPDGSYSLANVTPGTRTIRVVAPPGWTCSSPCSLSFALASGSTTPGADFALYEPASIAGSVYEDDDADATRDGGEDGLAGRTVFVDANDSGSQDPGEPAATTDALGAYAFSGLAPGTYVVRAAGEPGWICTDCATTHTLSSGEQADDDFGRYKPATITGSVYEDLDGDGTRDAGEPGIEGREVFFDADDDGVLDPGEASALSGPGGAYALDGIAPGAGTIRGSLPAGWVRSEPAGDGHAVTASSSQELTGRDFGAYRPASIAGHTANDLNGNGIDDPGEPGKAGWTMYLDLDDDGTHDPGEPTATTNASGDYVFGGLAPATYRVRPVVTAGFTCTKPAQCVYVNTLVSGEDATARDFALVEAARVSGSVYADADADGSRDAGEGGRGGRTVYVDYDGDGSRDPGEPFATTDAAGDYTVLGVSPGTFAVRYDAPAGEHVSAPAGTFHSVTFGSGDAVSGRDFGSYEVATIAGEVYDDLDNSGSRQPGEDGLAGRTVSLDAGADGIDAATTTDSDGAYAFTGLTPGAYRVTVEVPAGRTCSAPAPCRWDRTPASGESSTGNDFALYRVPVADLSLEKSAPATVDQGETYDYTLTVRNAGPDAAQSVEVADTLPAGVQFVAASGSCTYVAPTVTCAFGTIADGASPSHTITVLAVDAGAIENTATVSSPTGDPSPANDSDDADVEVAPVADVRVVKTGPESVAAGGSATYTITAHNDGPSAAEGVVLRDELPAGMTFDAAASDPGWREVAPGVYELAIGTLADGASASRDLVATAQHAAAGTTQTDTATVRADTTDDTPGNDSDSVATDVGPSADLALSKTVADASIAQGQNAVYTLTVTNDGPSDAVGVEVADDLPAGVTFVSLVAPDGLACTTPDVGTSGLVACSAATLADGAVATFTLTVRGAATGEQSNTAEVSAETPDGDEADNDDTVDVEVAPTADITLTKTGPASVAAGANAAYTITVANEGPSTAHDVVVSDPLPAGMTFVSLTYGFGADCTTGQTIECTIATLADGAHIEMTVVAWASFAAAEQTLTNTVSASADEFDPDASDDQASAQTVVGPAADLRLEKTASVEALAQNGRLTYTLTAFNDGPSAATNVSVVDTLPAGVSFVSASAGCAASAGVVTCDLGSIADGASGGVTITVTATANGTQVNTATVSSDAPDPDPSDNPASATVEVGPTADLSITKTGPASVAAGGELTYTLTAHNAGPSSATDVTVADTLPQGMTHVASSASQGGCSANGQTVICVLGTLANGASATVSITARATFALAGTSASNSASVTAVQHDGDGADNFATHTATVGPAADLVLVNEAPAHVPAGGQLLLTLGLTNHGPQTAANTVITETLPAGLTFVSAVPTAGSCAAVGQALTCTLGDLPSGGAVQVLLTVMVAAGLGGQDVTTNAVADSDTTEIDPPTNADGASSHVAAAVVTPPPPGPGPAAPPPAPEVGNLTVTKTADDGAKAVLGHPVAFTIRVTNASAGVAHGVVAVDQPSAAASLDSVRPEKGRCDGLRCELGDLAPGEVVLIHVVMTPRQTGAFENAVVVRSDDGDRDAADNRGVAGVRVSAGKTKLRLRKSVDRPRVRAGSTVWFTIGVRNVGPEAAANVRVCDNPSPNTTFVKAAGATFSKGRPCWRIAMLAPGSRATYRVKVRVSGTARTIARTHATASASNASPRRARKSVRVTARNAPARAGVTG